MRRFWEGAYIPTTNAGTYVRPPKTTQKLKFGGDDRLKVARLGGFLNALQVSPSGTGACALVSSRIICLDASTVKEVGRQGHLKHLEMILFEKL
jgi:hypothetical protein